MEISWIAKQLIWFLLLLISLTIHEGMHALVAYKLGDPTPKADGRVSLNPVVHIDLWGTIIFPLFCIFLSPGILFGWGRAVSIDPANFKYPKLYSVLAGCAGMLGNFLLCTIAAVVLAFGQQYTLIAYSLLELNAFLIAFNLLPIPGLDGFYIVKYGFRLSTSMVEFLEQWGFFLILILINIPFVRMLLTSVVHGIMFVFIRLSTWLYGCLA